MRKTTPLFSTLVCPQSLVFPGRKGVHPLTTNILQPTLSHKQASELLHHPFLAIPPTLRDLKCQPLFHSSQLLLACGAFFQLIRFRGQRASKECRDISLHHATYILLGSMIKSHQISFLWVLAFCRFQPI